MRITGTRRVVPHVVLLAGLVLTAFAWLFFSNSSQASAQERYRYRTAQIVTAITKRMEDYATVLQGGAALFAASGQVTRSEWRAYVEHLGIGDAFPGIQGVGYSQYIKPAELAQHIEQIRAEGFPAYTVRPEGERPEYTSIIYLEPFDERNQRAFGYDMFSELVRRAAMERARDTNAIAISGKVTLVQETEQDVQAGFLMYVPVYAHDLPHANEEAPWTLEGWVYSPFRVNDLFGGIFPDRMDDIDFRLFDGTVVDASTLMHSDAETALALERQGTPMFSSQQTLALYGHEWTLTFATLPPFASSAEQVQPWGILVSGIIITVLASLFVRAQEDTRRRAVELAQEMTAALRKRQEELTTSEAMWHGLVDANPESVFLMDAAGQILAANETVVHRLGKDVRGMIGENLFDLLPPAVAAERRARVEEVVASGRPVRFEDARTGRFIDNYIHPIFDGDGRLTRLAVLGIDITDRRKAEEETRTLARELEERVRLRTAQLESARAEAVAANRAKSAFLSRMSHELRTPLNAILGFAQLLGMDHLDDDQRESTEHILVAGRHLLELINEVLDISRIETGQLEMSLEPVDVDDLVADAVSLLGPAGAERRIALRSERTDAAAHVLADRQRLKQVLLNLLGNAVKYSPPGATATVVAERAGDGRIRISVADTGPGIPPELLPRLFVPFDRLGAEAGTTEGTGLGLALSRALVEAMGGTIGVDSTPGQGSRFWLELPEVEPVALERPGEPPVPVAAATGPTLTGTILCIEDNLSNFRLIERALALRGEIRLLPAMLGRLGLDLAREHRPDLVLLDLHLPDINGDDVLRELRVDPATRDIPVVVLSADATPGQVDRLLAQGARAYLTKPLDITRLLALADDVLAPDAPEMTR